MTSSVLVLSDRDRETLVSWTRSSTVSAGQRERAEIVLAVTDGCGVAGAARSLDVSRPTVIKWRDRFAADGVAGLADLPRSGRPKTVDDAAIIAATLDPPPGSLAVTHWSTRLLGTFRPRRAQNRSGELFVSFSPAVSDDAAKAMRHTIRRWRLKLRSGDSLADLADQINRTVRGWINFYGRFYRSKLMSLLENINEHLARWAMRKFKRLRGHPRRARRFLAAVAAREPALFAHWEHGARPLAG